MSRATMHMFLRTALSMAFALIATLAAAQADYRVRPGDQITVEVLEDPTLNRSVTVLPDGRFSFPFAGSLPAAGRTVSQLQSDITTAIEPNYANTPTVFVSVTPATLEPDVQAEPDEMLISIYMLGEVNAPGRIDIKVGSTFLQALAQAGGVTPFAAEKRVQLRRGGRVLEIDYRALSRGAQLSSEIVLADGDVILVPERRLFE